MGSNGSNETTTTPSRNGGKATSATNAMTSPVNVCIPQKIHSMTQQHVVHVNNLLYSQDTWDQAQPVVLEFKGNLTYDLVGELWLTLCCTPQRSQMSTMTTTFYQSLRSNISKTRRSVSSNTQTLRSGLKRRGASKFFKPTLKSLDI